LHLESLEGRWCPASYAITDLGTLGGATSEAGPINNVGQVAGGANTAAGEWHAFLWTAGATNGVATNPQMQDLGTVSGFPNSDALALNNSGQAAGWVGDGTQYPYGTFDASYWDGTAPHDLGTLGGTYAEALALNNAVNGHPVQVVGQSWTGALNPDGSRVIHAFLWQNGALTDLNSVLNNLVPSSGWVFQGATGINDNQQVVGFGTYNGVMDNWLWHLGSSAQPTELGAGLHPKAINTAGQVTGWSNYSVPYHGFLWTNGNTTYLPLLPRLQYGTNDYAVALNTSSQVQVVGYTWGDVPTTNWRAVLWQNGNVIDLIKQIPGSAGWSQLTRATGVNDAGQIVGYGGLTSGASHAFRMTPLRTGPQAQPAIVTQTASTASLTAAIRGNGSATTGVVFLGTQPGGMGLAAESGGPTRQSDSGPASVPAQPGVGFTQAPHRTPSASAQVLRDRVVAEFGDGMTATAFLGVRPLGWI
jgi:probable HAF family extracellular repeat protein